MIDTQQEESLDSINFKMTSANQNILLLEKDVQQVQLEITECTTNLALLDDVKNILTILKNQKMESKKEFILTTINTALEDVFDQGIKIDIEATSATNSGKINMKYDIVLYQNGIEMARNEKLLGNNGGGVLSFISILFKVLVGYIYSDNKFFLFDESISQVSPLYRPRLAQFLQKFCQEYDFTLVLVSQTDDIDEHADLVYLLDGKFDKNNVPVLEIDKIIGDYPQDKYVYTKIENFQSIVQLEFRYKGFTVVRGNNNIGKSASFRAVNALLFNTFDTKDHPRKKRPRGAGTKILFGKMDLEAEVENNTIALTFKSNKVVYQFDDLTFTGKTLAFEKVKEKVESIGFKYVNLKETYKNFKGNLKDQTERLAMTTQHDGFYLVGNKASETEKVFNFLFDSTDVANAIAQVQIDILSDTNKLNAANDKMLLNKRELQKNRLTYDLYVYKYFSHLIIAYTYDLHAIQVDRHKMSTYNDLISFINGYVMITDGIVELNCSKHDLTTLKDSKVFKKLDTVNSIISQIEPLHMILHFINDKILYERDNHRLVEINKFFADLNILETAKQEIDAYQYYIDAIANYQLLLIPDDTKEVLESKVQKLSEIISEKDFYNMLSSKLNYYKLDRLDMDRLVDEHQRVANELSNNDKIFGIEECTCCNGTGYRHIDQGN